ncbi:unnamed protein product, partial [Ascophyllum nodosum]
GIRGRLGDHQNLGSVTVKLVRRLPDWSRSVGGKRESTRMSAVSEENDESLPQVWASYISTKKELVPAIVEAAAKALLQLPDGARIDLALLHVSSIYGNAERLETVVPELRKVVPALGVVVGCSSAGVIGMRGVGRALELENKACLGLTLATLPGVRVQPFYLAPMDVPDPLEPTREWERAVRLKGRGVTSVDGEGGAEAGGEAGVGEPIFVTYSTSQSIDSFGDFVVGMDAAFPNSKKIGTIASTVSSLSRSCLFYGEGESSGLAIGQSSYYREGMVGVSLTGDIRMRSFVAQGARRVGPTFHADKVDGPVVKSLRVAERGVDDEGQDDWVSPALPPLAMIKQVQKQLSYEDARLVHNNMLVGVAPELIGDTAAEMRAISAGRGREEQFVVQGVVRRGRKASLFFLDDGSITIARPIEPGTRLQLFVRDRDAADSEFNAALLAYKRRELMETLAASSSDESSEVVESANDNGIPPGDTRNVGLVDSGVPGESPEAGGKKAFRAAGTLIFPGLDRGRTLWEEDNYQSSLVAKTVPVPMGGFFTNGVAASMSEGSRTTLFGSSTAVVIFSPITARRTTATKGTVKAPTTVTINEVERLEDAEEGEVTVSDDDDDFVVQRRDVKTGRPVTSGPVQYSVAETVPQPSNSLEALVWEKEAEVDRQRDRWPMSMLVSRVRLFNQIEENKPKDLIGALSGERKTNQEANQGVSLLAEIKRTAPTTGPIRRGEFDVVGIAKALEEGGAAAIAVNTDRKFFGCTYEDLTNIRKAVEVPVMCNDVVVYPYQIYQARLAGADAIKLIAPALPQKDLMYFHKISAALGMQSIVAVSSVKQMLAALRLPGIRAVSINNRNMATWALDLSRVDRILTHPEVQAELKGKGVTLLVEAGLSTRADIERAKSAGISCVVIGEAILRDEDPARATKALLS